MTCTILVVDDYEDGREMIAELLRMRGFVVATAASGGAGVAAARAAPPDVVLLDRTLPDIDGLDVARRLQASPETRGCAIVMLTAHVDHELEREARAIGCRGFVTKPCAPSALVATIRELTATGTAAAA